MNKYVVKLSPQELRHAKAEGKFSEFVERVGRWDFWRDQKVIGPQQGHPTKDSGSAALGRWAH